MVGILYGVLNVKSPAPPVVALVGLFAMLGGELVVKQIRDWRASSPAAHASVIIPPDQPASDAAARAAVTQPQKTELFHDRP